MITDKWPNPICFHSLSACLLLWHTLCAHYFVPVVNYLPHNPEGLAMLLPLTQHKKIYLYPWKRITPNKYFEGNKSVYIWFVRCSNCFFTHAFYFKMFHLWQAKTIPAYKKMSHNVGIWKKVLERIHWAVLTQEND